VAGVLASQFIEVNWCEAQVVLVRLSGPIRWPTVGLAPSGSVHGCWGAELPFGRWPQDEKDLADRHDSIQAKAATSTFGVTDLGWCPGGVSQPWLAVPI
jgi:hypothetical protein